MLLPILEGSLPVTALVATTYTEAALVMQVLSARGLRVPDDVSIIALGDPRSSVLASPSITVVRFSPADLTRIAVDLLVGVLEGRHPEHLEQLLPVELIVRGSTGPPTPAALEAVNQHNDGSAMYLQKTPGVCTTPSATHERR